MAEVRDTAEWRSVQGFPQYEVSSDGRARTLPKLVKTKCGSTAFRRGQVLKPILQKNGYFHVGLWRDGKCTRRSMHVLVAEAFLGPRPEGKCVRHLDGTRTNNRVENLAWGTYAENARDMIRHGRSMPGSKNGNVRYTEDQIKEVLKMLQDGSSKSEIGRKTGVNRATVTDVAFGLGWRHVSCLCAWSALRPES